MTMTIIYFKGTIMLNERQISAIKLVLLIHTAPKDDTASISLNDIVELIESAIIDNQPPGKRWK